MGYTEYKTVFDRHWYKRGLTRRGTQRNLKHYPGEYHMEEARKAAPELFGNWEDMNHD
jgi:hypothetical protein